MNIPTFRKVPSYFSKLALGIVLATAGATYHYINQAAAEEPVAVTPPAPAVEVTTLEVQQIRPWHEFSGRLTPVESAEIKPLVGGTIQEVLFTDGQWVEAGQPLFVIDPRSHEAAAQSAEARLVTAQSKEQLAKDELARAEKLLSSKLISQSLYDAAASELRVAEAAVTEAASELNQAWLKVEYAHISAPVSGRVSRAELTTGNVVEAGANAPVLATVVADDRFYAEFNISEAVYIEAIRNAGDAQAMPVELTLSEDNSVVYHGHIHAFDNHLDTNSGTIRARALVDNTDGALTAGMYTNVRVGEPDTVDALLVPERAIGTNQSHKYVYVVGTDNVAQYREITLGEQYQGQRVVMAGIAAGEQVVVNGLAHVQPNTKVDPVAVQQDPQAVATR